MRGTTTRDKISYGRIALIILTGLAAGIITVILAGQFIFDVVFKTLHPNTSDFWQNLVTLAIAVAITLIVGGLAFGLVSGIFYGAVYGFGSTSSYTQQ